MNSKTLFVIDDNELFREMAVELLAERGYAVREFNDAQDAMNAMNTLHDGELPDLIITDVNMPQLNGVKFAKILRENMRFAKIPLIICSNDDMVGDTETDYPEVYFIDKEFSQLLSTVQQLISGRS